MYIYILVFAKGGVVVTDMSVVSFYRYQSFPFLMVLPTDNAN